MNTDSNDAQQSGIMLHKGKKYAVGLMWLTASVDSSKKLVRDRAKKAKANYYCVRSGATVQHGLGFLEKGHRVNQMAAASMVADVLVGDWHGVFKADNGWWYVKVHSDAIAPDGDLFFEQEEDAYNHFIQNHEGRVWAHAYTPEQWDIENISKHLTLDDVLDNMPAPRLIASSLDAQFGGGRNKNIAIILFMLIIIGSLSALLGPALWKTVQPNVSTVEDFSAKKAAFKNRLSNKNTGKEIQLPKELQELPTLEAPDPGEFRAIKPSAFVLACGDTASQLVTAIAGWEFQGVVCLPSKVSAKWKGAQGTTFNNVRESVNHLLKKGASMNLNKLDLSLSLPFPTLPEVEQKNFLNIPSAILLLENRFLKVGGLTIEPVTPPPPPPPTDYQKRKGIIPKQEKPYLNVTVKSAMSPKVLGNYFDVKGLELLSIEWEFKAGVWTYKAKMMVDK